MKQLILRFKHGRTWIFLAMPLFALLISSCVRETQVYPDGVKEGEALVTLSLNVPAATRSLTDAQEEAVKSIHVLAFKTDGSKEFVYSASRTGTLPEQTLFQVTLRKGTWDLVVLANAQDVISGIVAGTPQATVLTSLSKSVTPGSGWALTDLEDKGIPMSSEVLADKVIDDGTSVSNVSLYRMVARVNVSVASEAQGDFKLTSARVYNYEKAGKIYPTISAGKPLFELPSGGTDKVLGNDGSAGILRYTATHGITETSCTNVIYLNPAAAGSKTTLSTNTCLVIGGKYDDDTNATYYRVDFSKEDGTYINLVRNHTYQINITKVGARGETGEDEAFDSAPVNMTVEIVPWNDGEILEVATDGQYELGVNRKTFDFFKEGIIGVSGDNKLVVSTTYDKSWSVSVMDGADVADSFSASGWLTIQGETGGADYLLSKTSTAQQNFYLQADANGEAVPRTAYIHVTAGRLTQVIEVTQGVSSAISLKLTEGTTEVSELLWTNSAAAKNLTVTWVPNDRNCTITAAVADGGGFKYDGDTSPFGSATTTGNGTQSYNITPAALPTSTAEDPAYPFIDRSSNVSFTINNGETSIIKTVSLRQVNYAIELEGFKSGSWNDQITAKVKSNVAWKVEVTSGSAYLVTSTFPNGSPNTTTGTSFTYTFANGSAGNTQTVTFKFTSTDGSNITKEITVTVGSIAPRFARSNIVLKGDGTLTFAVTEADNATIPANVQGLHFKWGSLVGISSTGTHSTAFAASHIVFSPSEMTKPTAWVWPGAGGIPYYDTDNGASSYGTAKDEFLTVYPGQPTTANVGYDAAAGKGDICRYISDKGWVAGRWRMPTAAEYQKLYDERTATSTIGTYPSSPYETISVATGFHAIQSGRWLGAGAVTSSVANMQTPPNATVFLPATGYRNNSNGMLFYPGNHGSYWSASPGNGSNGYTLNLSSSGVAPANNNPRTYGFAVRCVSE